MNEMIGSSGQARWGERQRLSYITVSTAWHPMTSKHILRPVLLHDGRGDWRGVIGAAAPFVSLYRDGMGTAVSRESEAHLDEMMR